jgi:hypothetical protein
MEKAMYVAMMKQFQDNASLYLGPIPARDTEAFDTWQKALRELGINCMFWIEHRQQGAGAEPPAKRARTSE